MERTMLGPGDRIDRLLALWQQDTISEDEYDLDELINEVIDLHGEQHASSSDTEAEVEASNLSTLVDTEETTWRPAWHHGPSVSRRVNDLERKFKGMTWDPAWGPQPAGMTAARMAALLDLFSEEAEAPTPTWAFPATDPRSQLPAEEEEEA
jgi:hypothetical protein